MIPLYRLDGRYYGFVVLGYIFDATGAYRGWVSKGHVWRADGRYIGQYLDRKYVVRGNFTTVPADRPPLHPPPLPSVPDPWPGIPPQYPNPDYEDAVGVLSG